MCSLLAWPVYAGYAAFIARCVENRLALGFTIFFFHMPQDLAAFFRQWHIHFLDPYVVISLVLRFGMFQFGLQTRPESIRFQGQHAAIQLIQQAFRHTAHG